MHKEDQIPRQNSRRQFLKAASVVSLLPVLPAAWLLVGKHSTYRNAVIPKPQNPRMPSMSTGHGRMICASCSPPENLSWTTSITDKDEQGEKMEITGTIYQPDGVTPAEGITLFVYHTDATGYYNAQDDVFNPRLRAWIQTGKDGRYLFQSIKPAPYPFRNTPAHIHAHLFGTGYPEYYIDDYWFEGDKFITPSEKEKLTGRGGFNSIIALQKDKDGILRGVRNIKLEHV